MTGTLVVVALSDFSFERGIIPIGNWNFPRSIRLTLIGLIRTILHLQVWTVNTTDHIKSTGHAHKTLKTRSLFSHQMFSEVTTEQISECTFYDNDINIICPRTSFPSSTSL